MRVDEDAGLDYRMFGGAADIKQAEALIEGLNAQAVIADKAYDADASLERIAASGAEAVIPPMAHRKKQRSYDRHLYKDRNLVATDSDFIHGIVDAPLRQCAEFMPEPK